jgi:hypothetical protein
MIITRIRPKLQILHLAQGISVHERVEMDGKLVDGSPVNHGPFISMEEAQSFLITRTNWWTGAAQHVSSGKPIDTYKQFDFDPSAPPLTMKDLTQAAQ